MVKKRRISVFCYKPVVLVTPKMSSIVKETFTFKSYVFRFMLPILGWVYLVYGILKLVQKLWYCHFLRKWLKPTCLNRALCFILPMLGFVVLSDLQPTSGWLLSHRHFWYLIFKERVKMSSLSLPMSEPCRKSMLGNSLVHPGLDRSR